MKYKNISCIKRTFYGVQFNPGETKEVPGYINHPKFVRISDKVDAAPAVAKPVEKKPEPKKIEAVETKPEPKKVEAESKPNIKTTKQEVTSNGSDSNQ